MLTMLKRAVKEAGANPKIAFHTLRRSFATMLKTGGTNINVIRGLLGHSSERTTALYIGVHEDEMDAAVAELQGSKFANG
jgi:integrase/recombinase XerD